MSMLPEGRVEFMPLTKIRSRRYCQVLKIRRTQGDVHAATSASGNVPGTPRLWITLQRGNDISESVSLPRPINVEKQ
jgi:hypothetical protein